MSTKEEVLRIGKKLEKMISSGSQDDATSKDMLVTLKKMPMTLDVLQKTHIGMTVNNFRKGSKNDEILALAKSLIKAWKKLLPTDGAGSGAGAMSRSNSTASNASSESKESGKTSPALAKDDSDNQSPSQDEAGSREDTPPADTFQSTCKAEQTSDPVRVKCRQMLSDAIRVSEVPEGGGNPDDIAAAIETCIHTEHHGTDMKYKNRVRSRVANLKDKKNPQLRTNLLLGHITPERMAVMTAEDMASEDLKTMRAKFTKESIDEHQMATTSGTKTDLLKCGRCLKRNCTYNQVQTRSADEPMTTFVFCNECGHRWKFC